MYSNNLPEIPTHWYMRYHLLLHAKYRCYHYHRNTTMWWLWVNTGLLNNDLHTLYSSGAGYLRDHHSNSQLTSPRICGFRLRLGGAGRPLTLAFALLFVMKYCLRDLIIGEDSIVPGSVQTRNMRLQNLFYLFLGHSAKQYPSAEYIKVCIEFILTY